MRIRTIKPEFWAHPVIMRLADSTKLLAIGLLNLADDEGFFYADPCLVRGVLRPTDEDSRTTTVGLQELSRIGYVAVRLHPTHGPIGQIVSFAKHQVINKPNRSKISPLFSEVITDNSGSTTVVLRESSHTEGNREGNREQGKDKSPLPPSGDVEGSDSKAKATKPKGPLQLRAEALKGRRIDTPLTTAEARALKNAAPAIKATTEDDWKALEVYYAAPQTETFSRKDFGALLNNWNGEIERARAWQKAPPKQHTTTQPSGLTQQRKLNFVN